jgi:DDE superfamily endonuclease
LSIRPCHGTCWAARRHPDRLRATYHRTHGVRYFHGCYSVGDDQLWGVTRLRKGADHTLAALKSIRSARPDGAPIYVILDNLSANKTAKIRTWARKHKVELCLTPTSASWANPIEAHFGPLRQFVIGNSDHPNHTVLAHQIQAYLRWRNTHARHPDVLAAQRRERARVRSERHQRWGRPRPKTA